MPTREEQLEQVETSLRQRFFPLIVEKTNKPGWASEQHVVDRLSRALAAYAMATLCSLDDAIAASAVTDGDHDGGIDGVYYDRPRGALVMVQAKYKRTGTAPAQDEILKTINGVKALMNRRFHEFNATFRDRIDEIEEALDTPGVMLEVVLVFLGESLGIHVTNDLKALEDELNALNPRIRWTWYGLSTIQSWMVAEETPTSVTLDISLENWACVAEPRKAVYGQISAAALAALVAEHGKALFERNIRHYLGSVGVNNAIAETARRRPRDFFYLNNGLTAIAEEIVQAAGSTARCSFRLKNVSIVNGAQTAGSLATAATSGAISTEAKLLVTLIEIGDGDDIGFRITKARNHQNIVRGVDFAALDPTQERLRRELAVLGITYHYRPSAESRARRLDAFALEDAAVAMACLAFPIIPSDELSHQRAVGRRVSHAVEFVVAAKKEVGRLWEQDGLLYPQLFPDSLSSVRMCRLVEIFRFIDAILADGEASESAYQRRMFFRHGRYFIMAVIAQRSSDVIEQPRHKLDPIERNLLSRRINEISELIYAESTAFHGLKGYLSIFRNMTDTQPLADRVTARLAERDRVPAIVDPPKTDGSAS